LAGAAGHVHVVEEEQPLGLVMSAAATAAGYLYASGRLRGRDKRTVDPLVERHGQAVAKALRERKAQVTYRRKPPCP
jgi:hypothetical protein